MRESWIKFHNNEYTKNEAKANGTFQNLIQYIPKQPNSKSIDTTLPSSSAIITQQYVLQKENNHNQTHTLNTKITFQTQNTVYTQNNAKQQQLQQQQQAFINGPLVNQSTSSTNDTQTEQKSDSWKINTSGDDVSNSIELNLNKIKRRSNSYIQKEWQRISDVSKISPEYLDKKYGSSSSLANFVNFEDALLWCNLAYHRFRCGNKEDKYFLVGTMMMTTNDQVRSIIDNMKAKLTPSIQLKTPLRSSVDNPHDTKLFNIQATLIKSFDGAPLGYLWTFKMIE